MQKKVSIMNRFHARLFAAAMWLALSADGAGTDATDPMAGAIFSDYPKIFVAAPPAALGLDPFYRKYVDAGGIPVTTSARVPDVALLIARDLVNEMLMMRPDLRTELI